MSKIGPIIEQPIPSSYSVFCKGIEVNQSMIGAYRLTNVNRVDGLSTMDTSTAISRLPYARRRWNTCAVRVVTSQSAGATVDRAATSVQVVPSSEY